MTNIQQLNDSRMTNIDGITAKETKYLIFHCIRLLYKLPLQLFQLRLLVCPIVDLCRCVAIIRLNQQQKYPPNGGCI